MSQEQPQRPVTYGDVFEHVQGELASQPVTVEDAALMQKAEVLSYGRTQKGGAASAMQAATDKNLKSGAVDRDAHSGVAEQGFGVTETIIDGEVHHQQFVGEQRVADRTTFDPTLPEAAATKGITIGEALEEAAFNNPDKIVDQDTARAIVSAEARATGIPVSFKDGVGAAAQSAAAKNSRGEEVKLSDVVDDATEKMLLDKVVTQEDVEKVQQVEGHDGIVTNSLQTAVNSNASANRYLDTHKSEFKVPSFLKMDEQEEERVDQQAKLDHLD